MLTKVFFGNFFTSPEWRVVTKENGVYASHKILLLVIEDI